MARSTALTGAAGVHYVAFKLSQLGFPAALTRGGSPSVDVLVGDSDGNAAISIQVKTSSGARREFKRDPSKNRWEFDVGAKALRLRGASIFYVFVDLRYDAAATPDAFIVPSQIVADAQNPKDSRFMFWISDRQAAEFRERWDRITDQLQLTHA